MELGVLEAKIYSCVKYLTMWFKFFFKAIL